MPSGVAGLRPREATGWHDERLSYASQPDTGSSGWNALSLVQWNGVAFILLEFSGAPSAVSLGSDGTTGPMGENVVTLSAQAPSPTTTGTLELVFLNTNAATMANETSMSGWNYIGTDMNHDFAWWRTGMVTAASATVGFSPATAASLIIACLK
jgi:hypothetical protein